MLGIESTSYIQLSMSSGKGVTIVYAEVARTFEFLFHFVNCNTVIVSLKQIYYPIRIAIAFGIVHRK